MTMNPKDGSESLVASVGKSRITSVVYVPASNEVMGVADNEKLVRVNVATKQVTTVTIALPPVRDVLISDLVVDKNNNLYGIRDDWSGPQQILTLVKIDPATGNNTDVKAFVSAETWYEPVYIPATNEIVGITNSGKKLLRLNLTTKDTVGVDLPGSTEIPCRELIVDNKSNLFAYKNNFFSINNGDVTELVKVNAVTGQETLLKVLPAGGEQDVNLLFVPQWNEFIGIWDQSSINRINATTFNITPVTIKAGPYNYIDIISN
ncbi:hypothetical protein A4H97_31855 [Niastella yeongjuensis]|uniref:Uncharacterized protein n=2 Tax=Niastella yeongjuensis TaxID=354355 RepID=A0A1V9EIN8_9BACT|nr:hypothetical protein A4H97_31855 [Niastella yeongjuensis]